MINIKCSYSHHHVADHKLLIGNKLGSCQHAGWNSPNWPLHSLVAICKHQVTCGGGELLWSVHVPATVLHQRFLTLKNPVLHLFICIKKWQFYGLGHLFQTVKKNTCGSELLGFLVCLPQVLNGIGPYSCWSLLKMQTFNRIRPDELRIWCGLIWFNLQAEGSCHCFGFKKCIACI